MKTHNILSHWLFTALICLILGACSNDDEYSSIVEFKPGNLKAVTYDSVEFYGEISVGNPREIGVCWSTTPNPTVDHSSLCLKTTNRTFKCTINGLDEGTQYYVRAWAKTADNSIVYGEQKQCITMAHGRPVVYVTDVLDIAESNATIVSMMLIDGGLNISEYGIIYGEEEDINIQNGQKISLEPTCNSVKTLIEELVDNQTYYVKSFAKTSDEIIYSKVVSFKTKMYQSPIVSIETGNVTGDSFEAKITATSGTPLPILEYGLVYGKESNPTLENHTKIAFGEGDGNKTLEIVDLDDDTSYYVRPYATNKNGVFYGEEVIVLTLSNKAMISTVETSFVTAHRAKVAGNILSLGLKNAPITEAGICWSTSSSPTIDDSTIKSQATDVGEFEPLQLFCLNPSTTYYARAYVTNAYGTNYGEEITFTTREAVGNYFTTKTEGDYFNGLNLTDSYPGPEEAYSEYQKTAVENMKAVAALFKRNYEAYRYYIYPNEAGEPAYLAAIIRYSNSSGTNYNAIWRTKMDISDNFIYTCTHQHAHTNTKNFITYSENNDMVEELQMGTDFIINDSFVIDWEDETSTTKAQTDRNAVFYMIPINSPENFLRMGVLRVTGLTPYTDWW